VLNYLRNEYEFEEEKVSDWYQYWVKEGLRPLEQLAKKYSTSGKHLLGDSWTLADAVLIPQLYNARRFNCQLDDYPFLLAIDSHLKKSKAVIRALPENQPDSE